MRAARIPPVDAPPAFRRQLLDAIPRVRRYARTLAFDAAVADDLTQQTLERALSHWRQFDPRREMGVWLLSIAQGEVVVVNDKFGIRLTDIITPSERIRRLNR